MPVNGSPICTDGRFSALSSSRSCEASTLAPPMPSRPVSAPYSTTWLPTPAADARTSWSGLEHAERHRVDERVVAVGGVEDRLAADVGDADAVAVAADAAHDPVEQAARTILVERAEAQRVEDRDRARAHREDVAQDPADARWPRPGRARPPTGGCGSRP